MEFSRPPVQPQQYITNSLCNGDHGLKDASLSRLLAVEARKKSLNDKLLSVCDGTFHLIGPPSIIDEIAKENIPRMVEQSSYDSSDQESLGLDNHSLTFEDEPDESRSFNDLTDSFESQGLDDWLDN